MCVSPLPSAFVMVWETVKVLACAPPATRSSFPSNHTVGVLTASDASIVSVTTSPSLARPWPWPCWLVEDRNTRLTVGGVTSIATMEPSVVPFTSAPALPARSTNETSSVSPPSASSADTTWVVLNSSPLPCTTAGLPPSTMVGAASSGSEAVSATVTVSPTLACALEMAEVEAMLTLLSVGGVTSMVTMLPSSCALGEVACTRSAV